MLLVFKCSVYELRGNAQKKSAARCLSWGYETRVQAQNPKPQVAQAHMDRW